MAPSQGPARSVRFASPRCAAAAFPGEHSVVFAVEDEIPTLHVWSATAPVNSNDMHQRFHTTQTNLHKLRFPTVPAEYGSFRQAAESLCVRQRSPPQIMAATAAPSKSRVEQVNVLGQGRRVFDLIQLRHAVTAADYGSVRRAAELLRIRHSIFSRSIRELEHSLGVIMFVRSGSGVKPTLAGRSVLRMARITLEQVDALVTTARSISRGEHGRLSIGFYTSISSGNLRATLLEFKTRFPEVELVTFERSRARLMTSMQNGAIGSSS